MRSSTRGKVQETNTHSEVEMEKCYGYLLCVGGNVNAAGNVALFNISSLQSESPLLSYGVVTEHEQRQNRRSLKSLTVAS